MTESSANKLLSGEIRKQAVQDLLNLFEAKKAIDSSDVDAESASKSLGKIGGHQGRKGTAAFVYRTEHSPHGQKHIFNTGGFQRSRAYHLTQLLSEAMSSSPKLRFSSETDELRDVTQAAADSRITTLVAEFGNSYAPEAHLLWKTVNNGLALEITSSERYKKLEDFAQKEAQKLGIPTARQETSHSL